MCRSNPSGSKARARSSRAQNPPRQTSLRCTDVSTPSGSDQRPIFSTPISSRPRITRNTILPLVLVLAVAGIGALGYHLIHSLITNSRRLFAGAETASRQLHQRLAASDFDSIYRDSSAGFKQNASGDQLRLIVEKFYGAPAVCTAGKMISRSASVNPSLTAVVVEFPESCAAGDLRETLTWQVTGDHYALQGFNVTPGR